MAELWTSQNDCFQRQIESCIAFTYNMFVESDSWMGHTRQRTSVSPDGNSPVTKKNLGTRCVGKLNLIDVSGLMLLRGHDWAPGLVPTPHSLKHDQKWLTVLTMVGSKASKLRTSKRQWLSRTTSKLTASRMEASTIVHLRHWKWSRDRPFYSAQSRHCDEHVVAVLRMISRLRGWP